MAECDMAGLVLARGGSKGLPGKNLTVLGGKPILLRCLEVMHKAKCLSRVWVSTDDVAVEECAKQGGACVHRRASYTATDDASSLCAVQEFLKCHPEVCMVCLVQCTSPFLRPHYLQAGVARLVAGDLDSVFSVTRKRLLRWSEGNPTQALNFDPRQRPRRQDWDGELYENGMFYIAKSEVIMRGLLQGERSAYIEIPEEDSLEIDTPVDLIVAETWLAQRTTREDEST
ncbi:hypothetical protein Pcinc_033092 [Petrolisthes cinctipes]|uniref:N-acylneuraminate cytidylyltransferase n=1 Tax=Petrolisthes cinctipes TaxID=88211 RepID=A0AAE1ET04_PETCI|nr:hypothetical protein Pcinc_033092 [Petrolisthes cinctipes]